jgi:hypothetical protein
MAKTVLLIFGIITIVVGGLLSFIFGGLLVLAAEMEAEYPGSSIAPGFLFSMYLWLTIGIILIIVGIILLILKARRAD